ncbi:MFS transporter, SP family, solute carrier family 2 (myo-inositol transporter), member 13 [Kwoniella mangroviensis CBS 10435]|uniref:MFS transporter, SP family, solute carrier family 2 (Myo-inositol transporter), member 13 n=1 Tax=Kwoniella mangroviensis CBS 10435 TaxID=1331196 RepID=A0A1B9IZG0_9TREE|nr:MFS transporter, SP family, solute carrier family 2 (myo-inositol transporter), member 13 [Kwoniella mangroviensis CBS 10435]
MGPDTQPSNHTQHIDRKVADNGEAADYSLALIDEDLVRAENEDKLTVYLCFLITAAAIAGFLFGYDTAVVGVALPLIGTDLGKELSASEQEIITAGTTIGAIFGSAILGAFADKWGRKWCITIADAFFTVGAVLIASSYSLGQIIVGRLILGVGVGGAAVIAPLYITELAPTAVRGRCIGVNALFIPVGQVVADAIGAGVQNMKHGWRLLFALGVVPSIVQLCLMHWLPESPRVSILKGRTDEARATMRKVYQDAPEAQIDFKIRVAEEYVAATTKLQRDLTLSQRVSKIWKTKAYRRPIITVSGLQFFGQLTGFNALLYYAGTLFGLLGLSNPALGGLIPAGVNALFLFIGMSVVDRVGRRGLLIWCVPIMIAGLVWCVAGFYFMCKPTGGLLDTSYSYSTTNIGVVIGGIVFFVMGYGMSYSHLIWYQSEFLALEIRAAGSAIATTTCWIANLIVSVSYLSELETLTPAGTYGLYLGFVVTGYIFVLFCFPESKGLSIDEIATVFHDGFGIRKSTEMRHQKAKLQAQWKKENEQTPVHDRQRKAKETAHLEFAMRPTRGFRDDMNSIAGSDH